MPQPVEPFVVRAGPGVVGVFDGERCTLDAPLLATRMILSPLPSLSLVTPALLGSGLVACTPKGGDGRDRVVRSRCRAETTSESG